ncbi:MAG: proton glutamate symport protein [Planctomycetota bacterium]|jgi:proton glutamate symport protein
MKLHWKVLMWMGLGLVVGLCIQWFLPAPAWSGASFEAHAGGLQVSSVHTGSPAAKAGLSGGDVLQAVILERGNDEEVRLELRVVSDFVSEYTEEGPAYPEAALSQAQNGDVVWLERAGGDAAFSMTLGIDPESMRSKLIEPFIFIADIFLALLKMLIVPLVFSSIVSGVASVGSMKDLRRLGGKTFAYYMTTSLLAIVVGQTLVNIIQPGDGAALGLSAAAPPGSGTEDSFIGVLKRMVPSNIFSALQDNKAMLQIIFFALILGLFITKTADPHGKRIKEIFSSFMEVMMRMAGGILTLLPYGVFALMVKVVASTGFAVFQPLLLYMFTVTLALLIHSCVTLPLVLKFVAKVSPIAWARAMSPALMTAFSTSSSAMTLPVTMSTVEHRGRVSNKVTSFTLPLGATINMDGTALYECIGVIFLAQYYMTTGSFDLTFGGQAMIVLMALLASVGAAGIPSAGLVMMLTILSALNLPVEGAALLLAVDRPLDMLRTVVNVWSDSCGAAVVARSEGEEGPANPLGGPEGELAAA